MTEIERGEVEKANDLFKRAQAMIKNHLGGNGQWDAQLFNHMVIQLQEAWPIAYAALTQD